MPNIRKSFHLRAAGFCLYNIDVALLIISQINIYAGILGAKEVLIFYIIEGLWKIKHFLYIFWDDYPIKSQCKRIYCPLKNVFAQCACI